jgi:hypothetical protein
MTEGTILAIFRNFGIEGGKGADSIVKAAMFATGLAALKRVGESDAKDLYLAYKAGYDGEAIFADNLKVQVSCFKTFLKPEVARNGSLHDRALNLRSTIDPSNRASSVYNGLVALNRAQVKKGNAALTDDEILAVLSKNAPVEKDEVTKLEAVRAKLQKLDDDFGGLIDTLAAMDRRIAKAIAAAEAAAKAEDESETQAKAEALDLAETLASEKVILPVNPQDTASSDAALGSLAALLESINKVPADALN